MSSLALKQAFSTFGTVERAVVACNAKGESYGHALVEYTDKRTVEKVHGVAVTLLFVLRSV